MLDSTQPRLETTAMALRLACVLASSGGTGVSTTTSTVLVTHDVAALPVLLSAYPAAHRGSGSRADPGPVHYTWEWTVGYWRLHRLGPVARSSSHTADPPIFGCAHGRPQLPHAY